MRWPIFGPKLSLCCSLLSAWGIIQLTLMGIFFFTEAGPLLDSFDAKAFQDMKTFEKDIKDAYAQRAYNCWIAAILYIGLLVFAGSQFMINQKLLAGTNISTPTPTPTPFTGVTTEGNGFDGQ